MMNIFIFQIADGKVKLSGGDQVLRTSTMTRDSPERRERSYTPKISLKDSWRKEVGSEVAGGGEDSQQTQPKTKNNCKHGETCEE